MKLKLNTIIFYVQDPQRLKIFYRDVLGLTVVEEDDIWVLLQAGEVFVGLHKIGPAYADKMTAGHQFDSNTKIVFELDEDIQLVRKQLLEQGVPMRELKTFDNYDYWLCDGTDPEGNVFQLKYRKQNLA
ncbi:VOC family protein [Chitinophaga sp. Cy-1792]|uniref:VOC family protein n=1 Tax=Chitinophaga sp. Cy-1792 TaxID=2608339 RepID=UPI001423D0DF|nr:VOC family protein [Chitinophaga sp. Cy-1792]NIG55718.1 VOC family protein [Chitinophaga sp. Cy-1792]